MKLDQLFQKPMLLAFFFLASPVCFTQVTEEWVARYSGPSRFFSGPDDAVSLTVDGSGNVYVTGSSYGGSETEFDYATIKYDATGSGLWVKRYNGPGNGGDYATSLAVDAAGNVYVTGQSNGDYATIKYDAAGNELWVRTYNGPGNGIDEALSLAVDGSGNVYVTGSSYGGSETEFDYATIKYDATGSGLWVKRYNGPGNGGDYATSLAVDAAGNVYVTGRSDGINIGVFYNYATIKYDAAGNEKWVQRYSGLSGDWDRAYALAVDASGNVYVTGGSDGGYATIKYDAAGNPLWVARTENTGEALSLAVDGSGNVYVTGSRGDYATVKYDAAGNEVWVRGYNGPENGEDAATKLAVDASGNVYVTGRSYNSDFTSSEYATIKYDATGKVLWLEEYIGVEIGNTGATALAVDGSGNVYVTGSSWGGDEASTDYATIKYSQTPTPASSVSSFTLINADTDGEIGELKNGDIINLEALSTLNLNIRANTTPATVGSVIFNLSDAEMRNHTENIVPYALFADNNNGDYYAWTPTNGNYTLTATPYSDSKGTGTQGAPLTIHFTVTGMVVSNLILVNAETDQDIKTLQNGDVIDLSSLPTRNLNIRAVVHPDAVGSVVFNLNNRMLIRENLVPYAIGGDIRGDYRAWILPTGHHTLTATPYEAKYGRGKKGKAYSVSFTAVDMSIIPRAVNQQNSITDATQNSGQILEATPNPFADQTTIRFSVPRSGYTSLELYDVKGVALERLYQAQAETGKVYSVLFDRKQLPSGVYMLRTVTGNHVQSYKLVLIR